VAQGVPEKPELETRTFRPSSGAALTATGFVDDSTKQRQFSTGLAAFSKLLQRGGEFEQKRRVFNDKIIAQTAIQLGDKNPTLLTGEGQNVFNNLLAEHAANKFLLKFNQHANIHSRNLLGRKDLEYVDRAALFKQSLDDLVRANVSGLQFNNSQKTVYGQKVLAHQLKLLDEFQKVNMDFVELDIFDEESSALTDDLRFAGGFADSPPQLERDPESGYGINRKKYSYSTI